ncbi:MAG: hypothetical protein SNJ55_08550 [Chloroherpetonaceae bacterium]
MRNLILFILILLLFSCGEKKRLAITAKFDDIFILQDSIKLESNDSTLIGSLFWKSEQVTFDKMQNLFICDRDGRRIFAFDSIGRIINKYELKIGEGPGEISNRPMCIDFNKHLNQFMISDMIKINFYDEKLNFLYAVNAMGTVLNLNPVSFGAVAMVIRPSTNSSAQFWITLNQDMKVIGRVPLVKPKLSTFMESYCRPLNGDTLLALIIGEPYLAKILINEDGIKIIRQLEAFPSGFKIRKDDAKDVNTIENEIDNVGYVLNLLTCDGYIILEWYNPGEKLYLDVYNSNLDHLLTKIEAKKSFAFDSEKYLYEIIPIRDESKIENPALKKYKLNKEFLLNVEMGQ